MCGAERRVRASDRDAHANQLGCSYTEGSAQEPREIATSKRGLRVVVIAGYKRPPLRSNAMYSLSLFPLASNTRGL